MSDLLPDYAIERTKRMYAERSFTPRNGKVFFKRADRTRGFVYEAEMEKDLLRLRPEKESGSYTEFKSIDDLIAAGWAVE